MPLKPEHQAAETLSADGDSSVVAWGGGQGSWVAEGTWGGGTATLKVSIDEGTTFFTYTGASITADGVKLFSMGKCLLKTNLAGSTSPTLRVRIGRVLQTVG